MNFLGKASPLLLAMLFAATLTVPGIATASQVYVQPTDYGFSYASQNDTSVGGYGNFATAYDDFTLGSTANITSVDWIGSYFNPPPPTGTITAWTVSFYSDAAGQPSASPLWSSHISGNGSETFLQNDSSGDPTYSYAENVNFTANGGTKYWLSVVPDMAFPPQWGWETGTGGDGVSWQVYLGTGGQNPNDLAFTLNANAVPEPGTLLLMATSVLGLAGSIRRKRF